MEAKILFVDDEMFFARYYVQALKDSGFEVIPKDTAVGGLKYLNEHTAEIDLLILDFMMPTPEGVPAADTLEGLATGRWFLKEAREILEAQIPVLVLTNRGVEGVKTNIEQDILFNMKYVQIHHKTHTPAFHLPILAEKMVRQVREQRRPDGTV